VLEIVPVAPSIFVAASSSLGSVAGTTMSGEASGRMASYTLLS
jgi:hypothetical protein